MWRGGPQTSFTVTPSGYPENFWPALAKQNPQSAALQFMSINTQNSPFMQTASMTDLAKTDQLIRENPQNKWLPAIRLMMTLSAFTTNRLGGELSDPSFPDNLEAGKPSPEVSSTIKRNFSDQDLKAALTICHLGEKSESQNSYYNWIESCLYWMSWQDDKARLALRDGASKRSWNNHLKDFYIATEQGYRQAVNRPLLAQEKIWIINAPPLFASLARYREYARIITWSAIKDRRAGNNARALQTLSDTHHLMYLASRGSDHRINYLVSNAIMAIVTAGAYPSSRKTILEDMRTHQLRMTVDQKQQMYLAAFVALAKSQHRPKLAHQIDVEETARIQTHQKMIARNNNSTPEDESTYRDLAFTAAWYLSVILLLSLLGTIVLLIPVTAGKYFLGQDTDSSKPFIGKIIYGALFSGGLVAAFVTLIFIGIIALIENASVAISSVTANVLIIAILLVFLFVLAGCVLRLVNVERDDNREFGIAAIGALISVGVIALIAATWPYIFLLITSHAIAQTVASNVYYSNSTPFASIPLSFLNLFNKAPATYLWRIMITAIPFIFGSLFFALETMRKQTQLIDNAATRSKAWNFVIWILKVLFLATLFSLWSFATLIALGQFSEYQTSVIEVLCCVGVVALGAFLWFWWRKPHRRASAQYGLQLSNRSLQLWLCLASVGILATLLLQLSVSKSLQQDANAQIYGDMSTFQQVRH